MVGVYKDGEGGVKGGGGYLYWGGRGVYRWGECLTCDMVHMTLYHTRQKDVPCDVSSVSLAMSAIRWARSLRVSTANEPRVLERKSRWEKNRKGKVFGF